MDDYDYFKSLKNTTDFNTTSSEPTHGIEQYVKPVLLAMIGIVGLLGNGALVVILRRIQTLNAQNTFILNLVVADLLVLLFFLPFTRHENYPFGKVICSVSQSLYEISLGVSTLTLISMSAFCFLGGQETTGSLQSERTKRNAVVAIIVIWAIAFVLAFPTMLYAQVIKSLGWFGEDMLVCMSTSLVDVNVTPFRLAVFFAIPIIAIAFFLIIARLNRTDTVLSRTQKEFAKLVLAYFGIFAVCFFPTHLAAVCRMMLYYDFDQVVHEIAVTGYFLSLAYRCLNPVALYCVSGNFRQLFNRHLLCWCTNRNREPVADLELPAQESAHEFLH